MDILLVLTTLPDRAQAEALGAALVDARHAACATVLPGARSIYRWQGIVQSSGEVLLLIKTTRACLDALKSRLPALHPYDLPEVIALDGGDGLDRYLQWIEGETAPQ